MTQEDRIDRAVVIDARKNRTSERERQVDCISLDLNWIFELKCQGKRCFGFLFSTRGFH